MPSTILLTGAAGFIGFHTAQKLLERGERIIGVDNLNDYYDVNLKKARLSILQKFPNFVFLQKDIADGIEASEKIDKICHLAAQAGVRYSLENPLTYERSNSLGTLQIFELARKTKIPEIVYASSSSVYGDCSDAPFSEDLKIDQPISLYAATKKANELYAFTYHHLFGIKMTGLRFFTVYGPWGRPDMAPMKFLKKILAGEEIDVYNNGQMQRDFTYIDDIVSGIILALDRGYDYEIFNLARGETIGLMDFIEMIETATDKKAKKKMLDIQPGDVLLTSGDITKAREKLNYQPKISIQEGIENLVRWYQEYYRNGE